MAISITFFYLFYRNDPRAKQLITLFTSLCPGVYHQHSKTHSNEELEYESEKSYLALTIS